MSGKFYALKLSALVLASLAFGFAIAFLWVERQTPSPAERAPSIARLDTDRDTDGLVGSVHQIRTETAKLINRSGKLVEAPRQLMELATYDMKGSRVESAHYLVAGGSYSGRQEYEYDDKGNISAATFRDANDAVLAKETYRYEFDAVGNWTKMTTSAVVTDAGNEAARPDEVTYRNITYYFDKNIADAVAPDSAQAGEDKSGASSDATAPGDANAGRTEEELPETFAALRSALDGWIRANNARDIDKEMAFYSSKLYFYYRSRNVARESVAKDKGRMFERAELIDVRAAAPEITLDKDGETATMRFRKQYVVKIGGAERYGDILQELRWRREDGGWKIIGERQMEELR